LIACLRQEIGWRFDRRRPLRFDRFDDRWFFGFVRDTDVQQEGQSLPMILGL
jgi:hypothetical protein